MRRRKLPAHRPWCDDISSMETMIGGRGSSSAAFRATPMAASPARTRLAGPPAAARPGGSGAPSLPHHRRQGRLWQWQSSLSRPCASAKSGGRYDHWPDAFWSSEHVGFLHGGPLSLRGITCDRTDRGVGARAEGESHGRCLGPQRHAVQTRARRQRGGRGRQRLAAGAPPASAPQGCRGAARAERCKNFEVRPGALCWCGKNFEVRPTIHFPVYTLDLDPFSNFSLQRGNPRPDLRTTLRE